MIIVQVLLGVLVIVYNYVFAEFLVFFILRFGVFVRIVLVQAGIHFRPLRPIEKMGLAILLTVVIGEQFPGVIGAVLVDHRWRVTSNWKHYPA